MSVRDNRSIFFRTFLIILRYRVVILRKFLFVAGAEMGLLTQRNVFKCSIGKVIFMFKVVITEFKAHWQKS